MMGARNYIGTSGWHYKHWIGKFYHANFKPSDFLKFYSNLFNTLELNNSFYHLPKAETFTNWKNHVPDNFVFAVKGNRYITHQKKLKQPLQTIKNFMDKAEVLEEKLGPVLFQLPPGWSVNETRLKYFVEALPTGYRYTFEFRNHLWYTNEVYEILKSENIAFCIYEMEYHLSPIITTANFVYIRLHGPLTKYTGSYSNETLAEWAGRIKK